jgi:hypothetical protein
VHLVAYSSLMRLLTRFNAEIFSAPDTPTGLNRAVDLREIALRYDAELNGVHGEWTARFARDSDPNSCVSPPPLRLCDAAGGLTRPRTRRPRRGVPLQAAAVLRVVLAPRRALVRVPAGLPARPAALRRRLLHQGRSAPPSGRRPRVLIWRAQSMDAAKGVVTVLVDSLAPSGYLRFAPDGHFVFGAFASAFLLKARVRLAPPPEHNR